MRRRLAVLALTLCLCGCSHAPVMTQNPQHKMPPAEYEKLFKSRTRRTDQYHGFYQTFQADVTALSTDMLLAGLEQRAHALDWTPTHVASEREALMQDANQRAKFYLRFYSPDRENDDFTKKSSVWQVYLDAAGTRYEGKVRKMTEKLIELQTLYPNQDRFSSAYEVTFDLPMTTVEKSEARRCTLTGNLGTAEFAFPPRE